MRLYEKTIGRVHFVHNIEWGPLHCNRIWVRDGFAEGSPGSTIVLSNEELVDLIYMIQQSQRIET